MENADGSVHQKLRFHWVDGMEKQRHKGEIMGHEISAEHGEDNYEVADKV